MKKKFVLPLLIISILTLAFQTSPYARRIRPFTSTPVACQENEIGYNMTSHSLLICTNSGYVALTTGASGSFAPSNATYIVQTANAGLSAEQALGALATGILKNTTTTGILSIAIAGTDYENALTFNSPLSRATNTISCATCALTSGNLSQFAATTSAQLFGIISDESGSTGVLLKGNLSSLTINDVLTWNGTDWINQVVSGGGGTLGSGNVNMTLPNNTVTGTTTNKLVKITGAPSTAIISATADTDQVVGVCTSGCGTTGDATVAILGQVQCVFDGSTTAGNFVVNSDATAGNCEDIGSAFPTDRAAIGRVLSTNVGAGTYTMELMTPDIAFQNAGNGKSRPGGSNTQIQFNDNNQFGGDSSFTINKTTDIISFTGNVRGPDGNNTAPSYSFTNGTNMGIYLTDGTPDRLNIAAAAANIFEIYGGTNHPVALMNASTGGILGWGNSGTTVSSGLIGGGKGMVRVISNEDATPASGTLYSPAVDMENPGGNWTGFLSTGNSRKHTLTANSNFSQIVVDGGTGSIAGPTMSYVLVQDATGGRVGTWESQFKWKDGIRPTLSRSANAVDVFTFWIDTGNVAYEISRSIQDSPNTSVASDLTNATTTFSNITGLSANIQNGSKYTFKMILYVSDSLAADGAKFDFDGGTATFSNVRIHCTGFDTALVLSTQTSAIATDFTIATLTGDAMFECYGTLEASGSGTLIPRFAQNSHTTGTLTLYKGSHLLVTPVP